MANDITLYAVLEICAKDAAWDHKTIVISVTKVLYM